MNQTNIKLIVSDIDGTLLPYGGNGVDERICGIIEELERRGIRFMLASGRMYHSMKNVLPAMGDRISYLCGNGSNYIENGKLVFCSDLKPSCVKTIWDRLSGIEGAMPLFSSVWNYYAVLRESGEKIKYDEMMAGEGYKAVRSLEEIEEPICKMGVYIPPDVDRMRINQMKEELDELEIVSGGVDWLDITGKGVNKGQALLKVLEYDKVSPAECMAFGDSENDAEMLRLCGHSYAMVKAEKAAKEAARYECAEVVSVLEELLKQKPLQEE